MNISEDPEAFTLELFAPGLSRTDLKIDSQQDILTIRYTPSGETETSFRHREYRLREFERTFDLKGKVNPESITARYEEGILRVRLPKSAAGKQPVREVPVQA